MHRKQLTHIFSLLLLFAACFLGGTLLARATASDTRESDNAGNETTGVSSETAGTANEAAGAASKTAGTASETAVTANEADASASKSWGLSYQEEGETPPGNRRPGRTGRAQRLLRPGHRGESLISHL